MNREYNLGTVVDGGTLIEGTLLINDTNIIYNVKKNERTKTAVTDVAVTRTVRLDSIQAIEMQVGDVFRGDGYIYYYLGAGMCAIIGVISAIIADFALLLLLGLIATIPFAISGYKLYSSISEAHGFIVKLMHNGTTSEFNMLSKEDAEALFNDIKNKAKI